MTTILVVDDNAQNLKLTRLILQKAGYEVIEAAEATTGLRLAAERQPALVALDMQMPGIDGLAATQALRRDAATRHIKVLALTALAMSGDRERILGVGCDAYLAKPFGYQELLDAVAALVGPS